MNQTNSSKQVLLSVIGVAILVVAVVGVSFAFFNYTRTGAENTVETGQILFNSSQTYLNVTNAFPVSRAQAILVSQDNQTAGTTETSNTNNVAVAVVTISGNTTYPTGLDFRITAQSVDLAAGTQQLPLSVYVTATGDLDNVDDTTDTANGSNGTGSLTNTASDSSKSEIKVYSYEPTLTGNAYTLNNITNGTVLANGHIAAGNTNLAETIVVRAFIDSDRVAISDTVSGQAYGRTTPEPGYTDTDNGTTSEWVNGRLVLSTENWNALANNVASFKIRVESTQNGGVYAYNNSGNAYTSVPLPSVSPREPVYTAQP